jgi:hypothetical protein
MVTLSSENKSAELRLTARNRWLASGFVLLEFLSWSFLGKT